MIGYEAKVIAHSRGPNGATLATIQSRIPRFLLPQLNTHCAIVKNARSSRAVPVATLIAEAVADPVMPLFWGANQRGMSATKELPLAERVECETQWLEHRDEAVRASRRLMQLGAHKQIANRLLEPFLWVDVVATATDMGWANLFTQRCEKHAQPEMQASVVAMARALRDSVPYDLEAGWWHLPYVTGEELAMLCEARHSGNEAAAQDAERLSLKLSVARCARVSFRLFNGEAANPRADVTLYDSLLGESHWSPFGHQGQAQPEGVRCRSGNFENFVQYRQTLPKSVHATFDYAVLDQFGERGFVV